MAMMKAWIYYRLSNDDDPEQNSLQNQRSICQGFAVMHGFTVVGESSDDNVSGMTFSRPGLQMLSKAAEEKRFDAVIVKDLSGWGVTKRRLHCSSTSFVSRVFGFYPSPRVWTPWKKMMISLSAFVV